MTARPRRSTIQRALRELTLQDTRLPLDVRISNACHILEDALRDEIPVRHLGLGSALKPEFEQGAELGPNDLSLYVSGDDPGPITFSIYYVDMSQGPPGVEVLIGPPDRPSTNSLPGWYHASILVPPTAFPGEYRIHWKIPEEATIAQWFKIRERF